MSAVGKMESIGDKTRQMKGDTVLITWGCGRGRSLRFINTEN